MRREIAKTGQASSLSRFSTRPFLWANPAPMAAIKMSVEAAMPIKLCSAMKTPIAMMAATARMASNSGTGSIRFIGLTPFWQSGRRFSSVPENMPIFYRL